MQPWEVIGSSLDWAITPSPKGMINPPGTGRLILKAKTIKVKTFAPTLGQKPFWQGFGSVATIEIAEGPQLGNQIAADVSETYSGCQAVVIGDVKHFMLPATAARASRRATMIMLLSDHNGHWHKSGLAVVEKDFTENWDTCTMTIGSLA
jgi:hypothetical protein